jgi:hypothetical protein
MAESGRLREREVEAGFEVALVDCLFYCLYYSYPLHHITAFRREYMRDWSFNSFAVWAGDIPDDFILFGKAMNRSHRRIVHVRRGPNRLQMKALRAHVDDDIFQSCRSLFLQCLDSDHFLTPLTSRALKSHMTVYQEAGYGTCWLAAVLNLILHVPETRIVLWNALNRKYPTVEDTTLEMFVRTPTGRRIFDEYQRAFKQRTGSHTDSLDGNGHVDGYPRLEHSARGASCQE